MTDTSSFERDFEKLLANSTLARTKSGFEYFVAPEGELAKASVGCANREEDTTTLDIVVNGSLPEQVQNLVVETTLRSEEHIHLGADYLVRAAESVLAWDQQGVTGTFNDRAPTIAVLAQETITDSAFIATDSNITPESRSHVLEAAKRFMGWASLYRGVNDTGAETESTYHDMGLWLPHTNVDDVQMSGKLKTRKGIVNAGFKAMIEKSDRHKCASCSNCLLKGYARVTLNLDKNDGYSDHHHYHYTCFLEDVLSRFILDSIRETPLQLG